MKTQQIIIEPELPIGTPFWFMESNRARMGLVAAYKVSVTSATDNNRSWVEQLFERHHKGTAKEVYEYRFSYQVKVDGEIIVFDLNKEGNRWMLFDKQVYFNKQELLSTI